MIHIVIPVFNRWEYTKDCIESLLVQDYENYIIYIVDHGSTDGTRENITLNYPSVKLLLGEPSMWWTQATNFGISYVLNENYDKEDFILTINNDLVVSNDYLKNLIEATYKYPKAIIGSISVDIASRDNICFCGVKWNSYSAKYNSYAIQNDSYLKLINSLTFIESDLLPGRGVLFPINVFNIIGLYDEKSFPHYMADEDFSLSCRRMGYKLIIPTNCIVFSYVNETGLGKTNKNLSFLIKYFTSIKSPSNLKYRWRWAKKNASTPSIIYFFIDTLRNLKGYLSV